MNDYVNLRINLSPSSEDMTDLMAAYLADIGYESFLPDDKGLTAYIPVINFDENKVSEILSDFPFDTEMEIFHEVEKGQDWNEEWEKNYFRPIVVSDKCVIHSSFHKDVPEAKYDIIIDPKMAFGTGHHATTSMMLSQLLERDLKGMTIIDMGTGTGILAILAVMHGAKEAFGIEIDPGAAINARENVDLNSKECNLNVKIFEGDASILSSLPKCDIFLANINRNVILADLPSYVEAMKDNGELITSGYYESDIPILERAASLYGLKLTNKMVYPGDWASCSFRLKRES